MDYGYLYANNGNDVEDHYQKWCPIKLKNVCHISFGNISVYVCIKKLYTLTKWFRFWDTLYCYRIVGSSNEVTTVYNNQ